MSVQTEINRINTAVETQTDLIAQIKTALQGKGVSGGGTSSGGSIETATVNVSIKTDMGTGSYITSIVYTTLENGKITTHLINPDDVFEPIKIDIAHYKLESTIECVVGTGIVLLNENFSSPSISATCIDGDMITSYLGMAYVGTVNGDGTITVT